MFASKPLTLASVFSGKQNPKPKTRIPKSLTRNPIPKTQNPSSAAAFKEIAMESGNSSQEKKKNKIQVMRDV